MMVPIAEAVLGELEEQKTDDDVESRHGMYTLLFKTIKLVQHLQASCFLYPTNARYVFNVGLMLIQLR